MFLVGDPRIAIPIPLVGAGFTLTWQALVGAPPRLTNGVDVPIVP